MMQRLYLGLSISLLCVAIIAQAGHSSSSSSATGGASFLIPSGAFPSLVLNSTTLLQSASTHLSLLASSALFPYVLFFLVVAVLLHFLNRPLDYFTRLEQAGYIPDGRHSLETIANNTRKRRLGGDLPPPFPNGWYFVLNSDELKKGEVKQVTILGQQVAVFRGEDGKSAVLDAYCPHLGANLAVGGVVKGCVLECPFHGWKFDASGKCVEIPYSESKVPEIARTKSWTSLETNGQILIWFHAEGSEPEWVPPPIDEINSSSWVCQGRTEGFINAHIQEVPENGADVAHLNFLHTPFILTGVDLRYSRRLQWLFQHYWTASWEPLEGDQKHVAHLKLTHSLELFGFKVPILDLNVNAFQVGPSLVYLKFNLLGANGAFCQSLNPVEPMLQKISHTIWTDRWVPGFAAKLLLMAEIRQVERDMMVWNNKRFISKPLLVKEDKLIGQFRRWYSQFYSEHSRDFGQKNNLDW